ncbi:MAG: ABC transporter ATP-binding protein, partial [Clostridia bacterium]|nr:ABC transporter ATP-binding protein [Clostridia bacterium]
MPRDQKGFGKPKDARKTILRLLSYLKSYRGLIIAIVPALIISSAAGVAGTYMLKPIINRIAEYASTGTTDLRFLTGRLILLAVIYLLGALGTYTGRRLILIVSTGVLESVRIDMFDRMEKLPLRYFDSRTHGEIMSRFSNDTDTLREMLSQGLSQLLTSTLTVAGVLVMMAVLSPLLTLLVLVIFFIMLRAVGYVGKRSGFYFRKRQAALAACNGYIEEMIGGQREVKVFCYEDRAQAKYEGLAEEMRKAGTGATTFG